MTEPRNPHQDLHPAERWIIDAMNVIGSKPDGWWKDRGAAMRTFAETVDRHALRTGKNITVVFDTDPVELPHTPHIDIVIARERGRNAGDREIERLVAEEQDPGTVRVVTSDRDLADRVTAAGGSVVSSGSFRTKLDQTASRVGRPSD